MHLNYEDLLDPVSHKLLPPDQVEAKLKALNLPKGTDKVVVIYCQTGTPTLKEIALRDLGYKTSSPTMRAGKSSAIGKTHPLSTAAKPPSPNDRPAASPALRTAGLLPSQHAKPAICRRARRFVQHNHVCGIGGPGSRLSPFAEGFAESVGDPRQRWWLVPPGNGNQHRRIGWIGRGVSGPTAINATNSEDFGSTAFPHPYYGSFGTGETFSFHPGGAHVALGDGSVRFLGETIGIREYARLVTRDNGEVVAINQPPRSTC